MKNLFLLITLFIAGTAFTLTNGIDELVSAFRSGNASQVAKYFDATVDITMNGSSKTFSKGQAEVQLKNFFSTHAVKSFSIIHKGNSGGSEFGVGSLVTASGTFRVSFFMKNKAGHDVVQELRFE